MNDTHSGFRRRHKRRDSAKMQNKTIETQFSIYTSNEDKLNSSFVIQIFIIIYGFLSFIDFGINILSIYARTIGIILFLSQLFINYFIYHWALPHLDHPLVFPHKTNWTAWIMIHFLMPIAACRWPEFFYRKITSRFRNTYPSLIFWGASRSGTTTMAHHLRSIHYKNIKFIGPFSPITSPVAYNKEGVYFVGTFGCYQNYRDYSMLYPMYCGKGNNIYFDGYPEYHCFPFIRDRLFDINPNLKFIFFVRKPCSKVISQWLQLKDTYLQITGRDKHYFTNKQLDKLFRHSLDVIQSEKYNEIYNFFLSIKRTDQYPKGLRENIANWICQCTLGRAMFGRDLKFWFQKFNKKENWLIVDMKTALKNEQSIKNCIKQICKLVNIECDNTFIQNWIPTKLKLNQNNIKYKPPHQYMLELSKFYENDQKELYEFINEKGLHFVCD